MPAYLVTLPEETAHVLFEGADSMVIFAADAATATDAAQGHFSQPTGANAMWAGATVTEIVAGTITGDHLTGFEFAIVVQDAVPVIEYVAKGNGVAVQETVAVNNGGTTYDDDDIETLVGGTFTRAATIRVTAETGNVVDTVELVDPGEYTVLPSLTGVVTTGNGDSALTVDITAAHPYGYEVFMGQMVTLLNGDAQIAGSLVDMSEAVAGARIFQVSSIGDDLGDLILLAEFRKNGAPIPNMLSTVVDEGISGAVLTVAIPATTIPIVRVTPVKGV